MRPFLPHLRLSSGQLRTLIHLFAMYPNRRHLYHIFSEICSCGTADNRLSVVIGNIKKEVGVNILPKYMLHPHTGPEVVVSFHCFVEGILLRFFTLFYGDLNDSCPMKQPLQWAHFSYFSYLLNVRNGAFLTSSVFRSLSWIDAIIELTASQSFSDSHRIFQYQYFT